MKHFHFGITAIILFFSSACFSQKREAIDQHKLAASNGLELYNRQLKLINEPSYLGIRLSKNEGEGIAWLKGLEFSNGILEFDVRGENIKQHSFVDIAFHALMIQLTMQYTCGLFILIQKTVF